MTCIACQTLPRTEAFASPGDYRAARTALGNGPYTILSQDERETRFRCSQCGRVWRLAQPDFPLRGYLLEEAQ